MLLIFPFAFCICFIASGHFQRVVPLWVNSIFVSKLLFAVSVVIRRSKAAALKSSLKSLFSHHSLLAKMRPTRRTYFERHQEGKFQYQQSDESVKFQNSLRHTFWWMLHIRLTFNLFILVLENQEKVELIWTERRDILNKNNFTVVFCYLFKSLLISSCVRWSIAVIQPQQSAALNWFYCVPPLAMLLWSKS